MPLVQVGVAINPLMSNNGFTKATYGVVVFSMVLVAAVLTFVAIIFIIVFLFNMVAAIWDSHSVQRDRANKAKNKGVAQA
jgi:uncharacterized membrane protein